jgi:CheY-like chemotaxis protein
MGNGERVLVVEDDADVRELVAGMLRSLGYGVLSARDAADALPAIAAGGVDLVLSDVVLPGEMSGADLAERLSAAGGPPVVLMSGYPGPEGVQEASAPPGQPLLAKPFGRRQLAARIAEALAAARARADAR